MFEVTSRYYLLQTATYVGPDGAHITFKRRRFLPDASRMSTLVEVEVSQGDRLDLITARSLGDPEQYWQVCDANNANNPHELTEDAGRTIRIPIPEA